MARFFTICTLLLLFSHIIMGQENITICQTSATESFAVFAGQNEFISEHMNPLPYAYQSAKGKMVTFKTSDGNNGRAYSVKANVDVDNYIFIFHEWWGLNDYIKKEADKYYDAFQGTVNIMAIDLYDGEVASTREKASELVRKVKKDRAESIIKGALQYVGNNSEIATLGWCFGGGWALQAAMIADDQAKGAVMYYGMPEKDKSKIQQINFPVLGIFAEKDGHITPEIVKDFKKNMEGASKTIYIHNYDAVHAFANPSNPDYNEEAAEDAYEKSLEFLKRVLD